MPPRPSQGAGSGGGSLAASAAAAGPPLPTLAKAPLPLEQLSQLQRRYAHMLVSLAELQAHVTDAQALEEWPALLGRHLTLVSQTHSLAQTLSLANPNALNAQQAKRDEMLLEEAQQHNKFSSVDDDDDKVGAFGDALGGDDALFGGKGGGGGGGNAAASTTPRLPKLSYSSGDANPLTRLAPHPFHPVDADKAQTVIPSLLLPRSIDAQVAQAAEQRWQEWLQTTDATPASKELAANVSVEVKREWIRRVREQMRTYDAFAEQATRSLVHAREAADEYGQRYDWKTRIGLEEESDDEQQDDVDGVPADERKRKRTASPDSHAAHLTLEQVRRLLKTGHT